MTDDAKLKAREDILAQLNKTHGKGTVSVYGSGARLDVDAVSTGSLAIDIALGIGGLARGRIVEVFGPESCLSAETFVQYETRTKDCKRQNNKGGTIGTVERLYRLFHNLQKPERGNYHREVASESEFFVSSINEDGRIFKNRIVDVMYVGPRSCLEICVDGHQIVATPEHKFWVGDHFVAAEELAVGDTVHVHNNTHLQKAESDKVPESDRQYLYVKEHPAAGVKVVCDTLRGYSYKYYRLPRARAVVEAVMNSLPLHEYVSRLNDGILDDLLFLSRDDHVHHVDEDCRNDELDNLAVISSTEHGRLHEMNRHSDLRFASVPKKVTAISVVEEECQTYDIRVESPFNNYVANGFVVHNSGKTTLTLHCVAEAQRLGGLAAFIDAEHALDPEYAANIGVNMDDLVVSQPSSGEQALQITEDLISSNAFDIVVIDSVAALVPQAEIDGDMGKLLPGLQARMMSQACRKLASKVAKSKVILVFINQIRNKIGVMFGSNETTSGGRALAFYSSQRLDIRRLAAIKDGTDLVGNKTRVKIVKNKVAPPFKSCEIDIVYGKGIDTYSDIVDYAVHLNLMEKNGSHYQYEGDRIGHGRAATRDWLEQHPEHCEVILSTIRKHFGI
mgnify:CR=1 FL=1|tara:strand:- start:12563 stop:14419 length:1857 start_codon:yes stop_codon:yes gene_type:complete